MTTDQSLRCQTSGNLCGTDTWRVGWTCPCQNCQQYIEQLKQERDDCEVCQGEKGGVKGNENVVDGVVMCDYCHAEQQAKNK